MENKEKFDFIKEKLIENTEEMSNTLSRDNMISLLENIGAKKKIRPFRAKRAFPLIASIAIVMLSLAAVKIFALPSEKTENSNENFNNYIDTTRAMFSDTDNTTEEATTFSAEINISDFSAGDYKDIIEYFSSVKNSFKNAYSSADSYAAAEGSIEMELETTAVAAESFNVFENKDYSVLENEYGKTNIQIEGIDEADIIKNDGTYLYIVGSSNVFIYRASDLTLMSRIDLPHGDDETVVAQEIYLAHNRLVIMACIDDKSQNDDVYFGSYSCYFYPGYTTKANTVSFVYNTECKEAPELMFSNTQDGNYNTSRLVGDTLYTVSQYNVDLDATETEEALINKFIPKINGKKIMRENIDLNEENNMSTSYVVVSARDISENKDGAEYAYLGYVNAAYCTKDTLYMSSYFDSYCLEEKKEKQWKKKWDIKESGQYTHIYSVSLSSDEIKLENEQYIRGEFLNQFSMDEYNGYFRCAVTYYDKNQEAVSSVIILDKEFNEVSRVEDIADNEEIKSVRFMGDTAYVVTFRNTDPLFVLDLSDPENPKKDGEVKLTGFSAYLHPISEDYIIGVGPGGNKNGVDDSIQVTLFNVSDKKKPVVCSSAKIKNVSSEINYNAKAFLYYPQKSIIGTPVENWKNDKKTREYILLKIENGKLETVNKYLHETIDLSGDPDIEIINDSEEEITYCEFFRGTYIDKTLYTVSERKICAFDISSADKINEKELGK